MSSNCPYCREIITEADIRLCATCQTPHHSDCWVENGGCTVFGCASAPPEEPKPGTKGDSASVSAVPSQPHLAHTGAPPPLPAQIPSGEKFFAAFLHDRRRLLRSILFVGFVAMPMGGLAGAILGLGFGFLFAIGGAGGRVIFSFPLNGLCYGQAIAIIFSVLLTVLLGESFSLGLPVKSERLHGWSFLPLFPLLARIHWSF